MLKNRIIQIAFLAGLLFALFMYFVVHIEILSALGIGLFVFACFKQFLSLGREIDVRDLMVIIASLQWIIGPLLTYYIYPETDIFYMAVDEETYMAFVSPASLAFAIGLYLPFWKKRTSEQELVAQIKAVLNRYPNLDLLLIVFGSVVFMLRFSIPGGPFFATLLSGARFIGLYFLVLNNRRFKWLIFIIIIISFLSFAAKEGLFHDLILWLGFIYIMMAFLYRLSMRVNLILSGVMLFFVLVIQTVKYELRASGSGGLGVFTELASEQLNTDESRLFDENNLQAFTYRINQGWIISRILHFMPTYEPFANGETIMKGLRESIIPRAIAEKESFAGYSRYFARFTGTDLARGTSMDISVLGEAYANYGPEGGMLFMLILGFFYNTALFIIFRLCSRNPSLLLWLPLLFLHVIKAETDFTSSMNYFVKASMVVAMFFWGFRNLLGIRGL